MTAEFIKLANRKTWEKAMQTLRLFSVFLVLFFSGCKKNDTTQPPPSLAYPEFCHESQVAINGYNSNAMEPFITKDGLYLFFNDSNDAVNTSLHYALCMNDTIFSYAGEIAGVNGTPPHLDAVASMDENNVFYFVSLRNYPAVPENYQTGNFSNGSVTGIRPVAGNFYIGSPQWIVMDAEISGSGRLLLYTNSHFQAGSFPDESILGIAIKTDTVFTKLPASDYLLQNVNSAEYLTYAPSISSDGNELFFTRIRKGALSTEICVSIRTSQDKPFSMPKILYVEGTLAEAPSLSSNGSILYYHKIAPSEHKFRIFAMRRKLH